MGHNFVHVGPSVWRVKGGSSVGERAGVIQWFGLTTTGCGVVAGRLAGFHNHNDIYRAYKTTSEGEGERQGEGVEATSLNFLKLRALTLFLHPLEQRIYDRLNVVSRAVKEETTWTVIGM